ncbi:MULTISPECIES: endonuclease/exonuclease/phosphatase family protein [unclassified Nonomuraea]|uniref:endonuclease/exonuclease/phosphatase family protein n=1 Tax=unclassified Nonomuraea TaxID=2593643 RepID=UPI00340953CC
MDWAQPYGPLIETTMRVLTWNVWGEYGPHAERSAGIGKLVGDLDPDVITMQEWAGQATGLGYHAYVAATASRRHPALVCGDFNAPPDSDEMRMLTGKSAPGTPGVVFYDAWEVAGPGGHGHTWSNANQWARPGLYPPRRIDYVLSAWPRAGGAGHPVRCEVVGDGPEPASDHYAVLAELRY